MITPVPSNRARLPLRSRAQRGVVLFIALIVLVAMSLAGIAIMRSVDTNNLISGNVAFKQGTLASADHGIESALKYLRDHTQGDYLWTNHEGEGYWASVAADEDPDWAADVDAWADAKDVDTGTDHNRISFVIHRLCDDTGTYGGGGANCATTPVKKVTTSGGGQAYCPPLVYYRVTVRVEDERKTLSIVQSNLSVGAQPHQCKLAKA